MNSLIDLPRPLASSGSLEPPKSTSTMTRMMMTKKMKVMKTRLVKIEIIGQNLLKVSHLLLADSYGRCQKL